MKTITMKGGYEAIVDDEDYAMLSKFTWGANRRKHTIYCIRMDRMNGKRRSIMMHRIVMGLSPGREPVVDHKDGNGLNNQKSNLRICTNAQNCMNRGATGGKSKYKGVFHNTIKNKWATQVGINSKKHSAGYFPFTPEGEILAAKARDGLAQKLHGEYARLNFPYEKRQKGCPGHEEL